MEASEGKKAYTTVQRKNMKSSLEILVVHCNFFCIWRVPNTNNESRTHPDELQVSLPDLTNTTAVDNKF